MSKKVAPWIAFNVRLWPSIAAALAKPWPPEAVQFDLAWQADQIKVGRWQAKGRPALMIRWGWKDWKAKQAIADFKTTSEPPANHQKTVAKPARLLDQTTSKPPANHQLAKSTLIYNKTTELQSNTNVELVTPDLELAVLWQKINDLRAGRALKLNRARAKVLRARVAEHSAAEILQVVEWRHTSQHPRAIYLREQGYGIDTLLRAGKFAGYLELVGAGWHQTATADPMAALQQAIRDREQAEAGLDASSVIPFRAITTTGER
jgi:hypothetical protein